MDCEQCGGALAQERFTIDRTPTETSAGGHYVRRALCDFCAPGVWRVDSTSTLYRYTDDI